MRSRWKYLPFFLFFFVVIASTAVAQPPAPPPVFHSLAPLIFNTSGPALRATTDPVKPFTVAGEHGVLVGRQNGSLEAWVLPVKLLSNLTIEADIDDYRVPIDVNQQAAAIEVHPGRTIITYSHIGFTVRQIMFSPDEASPQTGPVVLFEFDCVRPTDFTFRFTPNLEWMWPQRNEGNPGAEWVSPNPHQEYAAGGFYVLHGDYPDLAGAVTIPGAYPGILAPYQERPRFHPVELHLHIDPAHDNGRLFPLLMAVGTDRAHAANASLGADLEQLNQQLPSLYAAHQTRYQKLLANSVSIETPDKSLDQAFQWAVVSIEQLKARIRDKAGRDQTGLVAGYYESGDSARPGFGWFFGRDALYTLFAVNGFGDFGLSRSELEFLITRQRSDGKIMHEYSQTAPAVDWQQFPYEYAAADSTPLFLLAVADYVRSSGDVDFLRTHRDAIEKAWAFETDPAHDTGHDGIYDNSQGTGWVESWPGGLPHQEIYLALLDQQASAAMAQIEDLLGNKEKSATARLRAQRIAQTINGEYADAQKGCYTFSHNLDGSQDRTTTVYPALAWWSDLPGTSAPGGEGSIFTQPKDCLSQFASAALNTDWGLRDVANSEKVYDGMSYHQGSVWPLFTGWAALAEYRGGQPLAGYQLLKENANLTRAQDLGADTELLSGDFFVPFGRSTSHQLWSSAMVITPTLRGLFGISIDAQTKAITVNPHLPAGWKEAAVRNIQLSGNSSDLTFEREGATLRVSISPTPARFGWQLRSDAPGAKTDKNKQVGLVLPLPTVELGDPSHDIPLLGARTSSFRVLNEKWESGKVTIIAEGEAGSSAVIPVLRHKLVKVRIDVGSGLSNEADDTHPGVALVGIDTAFRDPTLPLGLNFHFPPGTGWKTITVTLAW